MSKTVKVIYNANTLETVITVDGKEFDTSRINGREITVWAYPFMLRKIKWNGFYDEMVEFLNGEKEFNLIVEGIPEALEELKEAWEDAPVSIITKEEMPLVKIMYDENSLETEILIDEEPFDTSRINGMEIEDWIYPFVVRKNRWNGIFAELTEMIGSESYAIQLVGDAKFGELLKSESPSSVIIRIEEREELIKQLCTILNNRLVEEKNLVAKLCIALNNRAYYMNQIRHHVCSDSEDSFEHALPIMEFMQERAKRYVPEKFWNKYKQELLKKAETLNCDNVNETTKSVDITNMSYNEIIKLGNEFILQNNIYQANDIFNKALSKETVKGKLEKTLYDKGIEYYKKEKYDISVRYFKIAIDVGDTLSYNYLGNCYYHGLGVKNNIKAAYKWYMKAAELNQTDEKSEYNIGKLYLGANFVKKDLAEAIKWFQKSADAGYEKAQEALKNTKCKYAEELYQEGCWREDEEDYETAFELYEKSAEFGNEKANNYLGLILSEEDRATKFHKKIDITQAIEHYRNAAESGHQVAMYNLGLSLFYDADEPYEAIEWLEKALNAGYEDARELLDEAYEYVTSENKETPYNPEEHQEYYSCYESKNFEPFKESEKNFIYSLFFYYPAQSTKELSSLFIDFDKFWKTGKGKFSSDADYYNQIYKKGSPQSLVTSEDTENERANASNKITDTIVSFWGKNPVISFLSYLFEVVKSIVDNPDYYKSKMKDTNDNENDKVIEKCAVIISKFKNLLIELKNDFNSNKNSIFSFIEDISKDYILEDICLYSYYRIDNIKEYKTESRKVLYMRLIIVALDRICDFAINCISDGLLDENNDVSEISDDDDFFDSI